VKKKYLCLLMLLAGCTSHIDGDQLKFINEHCSVHSGVSRIDIIVQPVGTCFDGVQVIPKRKMEKE
jgi:hypothetical protein